ncbi:phosphatidic Acid Phospholipase A1 [Haematobia irritans]|uniref:phosphatidic Acid Phospholipase A1 n=1 Tax=Haematobia irritans TaxID=7368 RepID=UPI003F4F7DDE
MSDSSKSQHRSGSTPIKNPLLSASVTGLTFDDFPNKPQLLPAAPPIVHAPPPPPSVTPTALLGREHKSLVTVGSSSLDTENLDEINLNASTEESSVTSESADANANPLLDQPNTSDSILSQAASSFSALPSVASNVFSTFSKRITAISSRETTPSGDQDSNGNFSTPQLDIQPIYTQQQHQQQHYQPSQPSQFGNPTSTTENVPFYAPPPLSSGPGNNFFTGGSSSIPEQPQLPPAEPPKFYSPSEVSTLPPTTAPTIPPPTAGGQNNFRFSAKKKLYAPIPGLSDQQQPTSTVLQPPALSAPLSYDNNPVGYQPIDSYAQPSQSQYLSEEPKSEEKKSGGGLFSKITNLAPTGVLQNITGLVQSAAGSITQTIKPPESPHNFDQQQSYGSNFGIAFDQQHQSGYYQGVPPPPPPAANYFTSLGEQQQANYPPPPPATSENLPANSSATFYNPQAEPQSVVAPPSGQINFFNPSVAPAVFDPFNQQPSQTSEPNRPPRPSSRPANSFSETGPTVKPPSVSGSRPPSQPGIYAQNPTTVGQTPITFFNPLQSVDLGATTNPPQGGLFDPSNNPNANLPLSVNPTPPPPQLGFFDPSKYLPNNSNSILPPTGNQPVTQSSSLPPTVTPTPPPAQVGLFDPTKYSTQIQTQNHPPPAGGSVLPPPSGQTSSYRLQKGTKLYKNPLTAQETAPVQVTPNLSAFGAAPVAFPPSSYGATPNNFNQSSPAATSQFGQIAFGQPSLTPVANIFVPSVEPQSVPLFAPNSFEQDQKKAEDSIASNLPKTDDFSQSSQAATSQFGQIAFGPPSLTPVANIFVPSAEAQSVPLFAPNSLDQDQKSTEESIASNLPKTDVPQSGVPPQEISSSTATIPEIKDPQEVNTELHSSVSKAETQSTDPFLNQGSEGNQVSTGNINKDTTATVNPDYFFKPIESITEQAQNQATNFFSNPGQSQQLFTEPSTKAVEEVKTTTEPLEQSIQNLNLTEPSIAGETTSTAALPPPKAPQTLGENNPYRRGSTAETNKSSITQPSLANFFTPATSTAASGTGDFNFFASLPTTGDSFNLQQTTNEGSSNFFSAPTVRTENPQQFFNPPFTNENLAPQQSFFTPTSGAEETKSQQDSSTNSNNFFAATATETKAAALASDITQAATSTPYPSENSPENSIAPALPSNIGIISTLKESSEEIKKHQTDFSSNQDPPSSIGFENFLPNPNHNLPETTNFFTTAPSESLSEPIKENSEEIKQHQTVFNPSQNHSSSIGFENFLSNPTQPETTNFFNIASSENLGESKQLENPTQLPTSIPTPYPAGNHKTDLFSQLSTQHINNNVQREDTSSELQDQVPPPPIGFENFVTTTPQSIATEEPIQSQIQQEIPQSLDQVQQQPPKPAVNNFPNFFNHTSASDVSQQEPITNTSSFFDNFTGQSQALVKNLNTNPQVSNEEQRIQNFFNNPPPKDAYHVGDLNYDLVHSGLAIRNLQQRLTPVSNLVEPSSSACSEFSALNASDISGVKDELQRIQESNTVAEDSTFAKHYGELPEEVLKELRMANLLQGDKSSPVASTSYKPAVKHWFYKRTVDGKPVWVPFSHYDSALLETSLIMEGEDKPEVVAVEGGRYDVNIGERLKRSVYWESEPIEVRRCSWFYKAVDSKYIPYEESTADVLEAEYKQAAESGVWHKTILLSMGEQVLFHGPTVIVHYQHQQNPDAWGGTSQSTTRPRVVKRDLEDFNIAQGESQKVDHLLFMVHGIGSACDLKMRSVEEVVEDFRAIAHQLVLSHYKNSADLGLVGRVEVLPISWHSHLHSIELGIDEKLRSITLESIPKLRNFTNDTLLDILFYTSPTFAQRITNTIVMSLNDIYMKYRQRHPDFNGGVSLAGHSLGSLILFDLLCHQQPIKESEEKNLENPDQEFLTSASSTATASGGSNQTENNQQMEPSPISYTMGPDGTGQPFIKYGQLKFQPKKFFALGSPIGMFVTIRGIDKLGLDFRLPTCPGFYNIFHPYDPVAYRIEALVNPDLSGVRPVLIPHHKGRKRMHLELKETMARVSTDIKQRFLDKFKITFDSVNIFGQSTKNKKETEELMEKEVEKVIEMQMQLERQGNQQQQQTQSPDQLQTSSPSDDRKQYLSSPTSANQSMRTRTDSVSTAVSDDMIEVDFPLGKLNDSKRIDYVLQEAPLEFINEYIFALSSHVCYWDSEDTILFVMREIYSGLGISPDSQVPQQTMTIERPSSRTSSLSIS